MSNYRSAYENYYKNINDTSKEKKDNNKYFSFGKKANNNNPQYGVEKKYNDKIINILIKRITKELTGALILLIFFVGLKYIPSAPVKEMYIKCKEELNQNFNYNDSIEAFNNIQIGNIQGKDLKMGDVTVEDLKIENLKMNASNFMQYLKNSTNSQN